MQAPRREMALFLHISTPLRPAWPIQQGASRRVSSLYRAQIGNTPDLQNAGNSSVFASGLTFKVNATNHHGGPVDRRSLTITDQRSHARSSWAGKRTPLDALQANDSAMCVSRFAHIIW